MRREGRPADKEALMKSERVELAANSVCIGDFSVSLRGGVRNLCVFK